MQPGVYGLVVSGHNLVLCWSWHRVWCYPQTPLLCFGLGWACHSRRTKTGGVPGWSLGGHHSSRIPIWSSRFSIPPSVFGCWEMPPSMTELCLLFCITSAWLSVACGGLCRKLWQNLSIYIYDVGLGAFVIVLGPVTQAFPQLCDKGALVLETMLVAGDGLVFSSKVQ